MARHKLRGDVSLIVQHDDEGVDASPVKHGVGAERAGDGDALANRGLDRRLDGLDLLAPEQTAFTRVRVEAADRELRRRRSQALERAVGGRYDAHDIFARHHLDRLPHAAVQRRVHDLHVVEAQHQVNVVLVGAGGARDEGGIAVERDAGERDRRLVLRRCHDRVHLARERELDRRAGEGERGAAVRGAAGTEVERGEIRLGAAEHVDSVAGPVGIGGARDHAQVGRDAARRSMAFEHAGIADHDRIAGVAHGGIERSLEADLRSDARRIARGNGNSRFVAHAWTPAFYIGGTEQMRERLFIPNPTHVHILSSPRKRGPITTASGIWVPAYAGTTAGKPHAKPIKPIAFHSHGMREAWITSGTPWPPTDLMARSTSLSLNLWVVTLSNGKRFEASCASASSHALKLWPRALLMVMNFTVTFSSGKLGNSFISP